MRSIMKKLGAAIVAGAMLCSVSACGNSASGSGDDNKLTIAWWGNQQRNDRMGQIDKMFEEQNQGVSIDGQFSEFYDYWQKLSTNAAGKSMPDIIQMDYIYLNRYIESGLLQDMQPYIDDGTINLDNVDDKVIEPGQKDGKTYALVNAVNAPVLVYNKTLLDNAGITVPENMTLDEFESISKQVYEKTGYKTNFYYYETCNVMEYLLRGEGVQLFEDTKLGVDSAAQLEEYFNVYQTGIKEGWHLAPEVYTEIKVGSNDQNPLVYGSDPSHRSWVTFAFTNNVSAFQSSMPNGDKVAVANWPSSNTTKSNYVKPSQFFAISRDCKNPKLAAKWIDFYTNNEDANKILLTDRGLPISSKIQTAIKPSLDESDVTAMDFLNDVIIPNSSTINPAWPSAASTVGTKVLPTIEESLCYGTIDAKTAAQQFFDQANETLAKG
ncbi:ABC transporter, extracellular substrate binding protein [Bifidobacterium sp. DSM 109958]|uniref:ABC transporter, extracellular substrate binding protein n=1 Tax=Bifidobacterium moraviense TaxID=2675323 RepID=A0A7Y0I057_9BIFI|nr:ABC transporter substrate-binding protein [Bifidobacterium sp. DSM 109958]NMN01118.1 ABC transporter, extracellular substrate binding protein [Bifidobacterium sp. DSM 109958]